MATKNKVNFIGIGAHKGGTTWLWRMLNQLSQFDLPPIKELHYFDRDKKYQSPNKLSEPYFFNRVRNIDWLKHVVKTGAYHLRYTKLAKFPWLMRWYCSTYNDSWYLSLFESMKGITGEISPAYAILDEEDIEKKFTLLPNVKIIYFLRNPIDREWSAYRFANTKGFTKHINSGINTILTSINNQEIESRANYVMTLERFTTYFQMNNFLICFYDAIIDNPNQLLTDIVNFLGGDSSKIESECRLQDKANVSVKYDMPPEVKAALKIKYHAMMQELAYTLGGYCQKWDNEANDLPAQHIAVSPTLVLREPYSLMRQHNTPKSSI